MCTITYIPFDEKSFVVTDNRDEAVGREALLPEMYEELGAKLYYPRDVVAGGTWIGVSDRKNLVCLMNGAFSRHKRKASYRKSRGLVVKELLASEDLIQAAKDYDLEGIEQFFALMFSWKDDVKVYELIWDGEKKHLNEVDATEPKIWSAAMTYGEEQRLEREEFLATFLEKHIESGLSPQDIIDFHHLEGNDEREGMVIRRGVLQTTSISQFRNLDSEASFYFKSLVDEREQEEILVDL